MVEKLAYYVSFHFKGMEGKGFFTFHSFHSTRDRRSRSSPLALAACSHSLTSCTSCYDERSLAYHALGYGRGSHKPAVVITSSGTAVSNLFPAVVEASQDFVPLLMLTADRPPELLDTGANQAIDQVNHFGKFVKFFSLPPPTDEMPARMILTTIDSAVYSASQSPCGPVHVNCPFREPLEDSPKAWDSKCLEGLNLWMLKEEPYTKYIKVQRACSYSHDNMSMLLDIIKGANEGLLVVGSIQAEDEIWAALQLVKHLSWPTVPDILSGLRLRRQLTSHNSIEHNILFLDHLDHALLSGSVKSWLKPDVVVQVAMEMSFQIYSESFLTEPYVAHVIGDVLKGDTALFVGNSMTIRDLDMYGNGWIKSFPTSIPVTSSCNMQFHFVQTSGNRGASGIDGLLSTSIGFAVGSNKRVVCVIGDISFLHDTNGLAILSSRTRRKPVTIVVINNHGGAIFSLLPIALETEPSVLNQFFYTKHDISIEKLCMAHGVKHLLVQTKMELHHALWEAHQGQNDCVVEVESCIPDNARFHSIIRKYSCLAAEQAFKVLLGMPIPCTNTKNLSICKISKLEYSLYRIQLCAPPTSTLIKHDKEDFFHEGFVLTITLDDKVIGYGEIAPIAIHKEDLLDVEEQLRFLVHAMEGAELSCVLPLLKGSFTHWIQKSLGIFPSSIFPSVRCGIEMAILNALATRQGSSISDLSGYQSSLVGNQIITHGKSTCKLTGIPICALVDCLGTPKEVAYVVSQLFHGGFTTVKMKVARREDPTEDAAVIREIRQSLGYQISIRVDANRKWTYDKAVQFATSVKNCALEYIEEPVCFEDDIITFCEETGLFVALDETIDNITWENLHKLGKFVHPGIVAVVIKPSVVGGFENALLIAKWAQKHEKMAIVSSTFESGLGLSAYVQFAQIIEDSNKVISEIRKIKYRRTVAHGLGTFQWLKQDVSIEALKISVPPKGSRVEAFVVDADTYVRNFQLNHEVVVRKYGGEQFRSYNLEVNTKYISYRFKLLESVCAVDGKVVIFLHGFLGSSQDWIPLMKALSGTTQCIAVDLPGHGESRVRYHTEVSKQEPYLSFESVTEALVKLICETTTSRVILVGYSMGGRMALHMSLKYSEKVDGAVIISGSPGLRDEITQRICISQDKSRALYLLSHGLPSFLDTWYEGSLWKR
ncbi:hypothetical protein HPP92_019404 [Vanilla planifolia]|uniref:Mandelate racemase/muconate lactonizing enzyme C-terminal domain-containing protein n=1 Tax=Vanilla planifolia TaxID=51239 RepID=A0A835Q346_VANPL|nr:hypothetical protein HPP92_019404 [Vanilla planifolia]